MGRAALDRLMKVPWIGIRLCAVPGVSEGLVRGSVVRTRLELQCRTTSQPSAARALEIPEPMPPL
jgi:hypothetical protein